MEFESYDAIETLKFVKLLHSKINITVFNSCSFIVSLNQKKNDKIIKN